MKDNAGILCLPSLWHHPSSIITTSVQVNGNKRAMGNLLAATGSAIDHQQS